LQGIAYEVESHVSAAKSITDVTDEASGFSSLFKGDRFLKLPRTQEKLLAEIHADNEYNMARYPNVEFYVSASFRPPAA
jgi:hypothetical protein